MIDVEHTKRPGKRNVVGNVKRDLESIGLLYQDRKIFELLERQHELAEILRNNRLPDHKRPLVAMEMDMTAAELKAALMETHAILHGVGCNLAVRRR